MKILFINAIDPSREIERRYPPLGIGYLCSYLRSRFPDDAIECKVIDGEVERCLREYAPDIVGISAVTQNFNKAIAYARLAKGRGITVLCGGIHISMLPSSLTADMDVGVIGEGEETVCDLYALFRKEKRLSADALAGIPGIAYRDASGAVVLTGPREQIRPLDAIPFPARDLFAIGPETYIFSSRGCPYACTFCASSRFWKKVRFFSADYVVREIEYLYARYGVRKINFYDDLFCADIPRLKEIIALLEQKGLAGKIEYAGALRANLVTEELARLLKRMGFVILGIGLESGCPETLAYLKGGNVGVDDNARAVALLKKEGMKVHGSFIIGSPHETAADAEKTLRFIQKSGIDGFDVYLLTPFPGTPVWDYALARGLVNAGMDWSILNVDFGAQPSRAVILSETMSREELRSIYQKFMQYGRRLARVQRVTYYLRLAGRVPGLVWRKLTCGRGR